MSRSVQPSGCIPPGSVISSSWTSPSRSLLSNSSSGHMLGHIPTSDLARLRSRPESSASPSSSSSSPSSSPARDWGASDLSLRSDGRSLLSAWSDLFVANRRAFLAARSAFESCCCCRGGGGVVDPPSSCPPRPGGGVASSRLGSRPFGLRCCPCPCPCCPSPCLSICSFFRFSCILARRAASCSSPPPPSSLLEEGGGPSFPSPAMSSSSLAPPNGVALGLSDDGLAADEDELPNPADGAPPPPKADPPKPEVAPPPPPKGVEGAPADEENAPNPCCPDCADAPNPPDVCPLPPPPFLLIAPTQQPRRHQRRLKGPKKIRSARKSTLPAGAPL